MAYATYITEAIVCGSRDQDSADRSCLLFTKHSGMLWGTARSVREEKSKQRYALQDFSLIRVSLVRGKGGWRIGSVEAIENAYFKAQAKSARTGVHAILMLLRRFLHGEEPQPEVFSEVREVLRHLPHLPPESISNLVDQFTLRLLSRLGYVATHTAYSELLNDLEWWRNPQALPPAARLAIDQAVRESHL